MRTVFDFAAKRAELAPDAVGFEDAEDGRRITFAAFNERAERAATALEEMGVAEGGRVAILCHNSVTFLPKHVTVIDDYPRTAAGKVRKHVLRQMLTRAETGRWRGRASSHVPALARHGARELPSWRHLGRRDSPCNGWRRG